VFSTGRSISEILSIVKTKPELHLIGQIGYFLPRIEHLCKQAYAYLLSTMSGFFTGYHIIDGNNEAFLIISHNKDLTYTVQSAHGIKFNDSTINISNRITPFESARMHLYARTMTLTKESYREAGQGSFNNCTAIALIIVFQQISDRSLQVDLAKCITGGEIYGHKVKQANSLPEHSYLAIDEVLEENKKMVCVVAAIEYDNISNRTAFDCISPSNLKRQNSRLAGMSKFFIDIFSVLFYLLIVH
jgi:hypothetical protein